jgi:hypothetical protein
MQQCAAVPATDHPKTSFLLDKAHEEQLGIGNDEN